MFNFGAFIKKGLLDAVGKMPDYWVIMNAAGWHEKGVLTAEDLEDISAKIDALKEQEAPPEPEMPEVPTEQEAEA